MVIFGCGLVSGVLLVKTTSQNVHQSAPAPELPAPVVFPSNALAQAPTNAAVVTRTNVVWAPFQAQRMALLRQMVNRLHLDPDQRERIGQILRDSQERNKELWQEIAPQMHEEFKRVTEDIRQELDPPQQRKFREMLRENHRENRAKSGLTNAPPVPDKTTNDPDQAAP
jgi:uncharacterized membrane protein